MNHAHIDPDIEQKSSIKPVSFYHRKLKLSLLSLGGIVLCFGAYSAALWFSSPPVIHDEPSAQQGVELSAEKQKAIWDSEHITFKMEHHFGKAFTTALAGRDASALTKFARDQFLANVPSQSENTPRQHSVISEKQWRSERESRQLNATDFAEWMIDRLSAVSQIERIRLRILQIEKKASKPDEWWAQVLLSVSGQTADKKPIQVESHHAIEFQFEDSKAIGQEPLLDRWLVESEHQSTSDQQLMEEVTKQVGLSDLPIPDNWTAGDESISTYGMQVAVEDFDRDGYLDIAIATIEGHPPPTAVRSGQTFCGCLRFSRLEIVESHVVSGLWLDRLRQ